MQNHQRNPLKFTKVNFQNFWQTLDGVDDGNSAGEFFAVIILKISIRFLLDMLVP
jgi:hypothetical protein